MLFAQTVAFGVDGVFGSVGRVEVDMVIVMQVAVHHIESLLHQLAHLFEVGVKTSVKVDGVFALALACHSNLVNNITYGFEVVNDAEHGADAFGCMH